MKTTNESYQKYLETISNDELTWILNDCQALMNFCQKNGDMETYHNKRKERMKIKAELKRRNEITPITSQNIDEKIEDLKITNFYEIVSSKSSFQEAYDFVKNNYTIKELLLIDNSIPDYEGYNWKKDEGIRHLICSIKFNIAS
jgi:hypothetical protein